MSDPRPDNQRTTRRRRAICLGALLLCAIGAWVATAPSRNRMNQETERINREVAAVTNARTAAQMLLADEAAARKRISANPADTSAHLALASALGRQRKYAEAVSEIKIALALEPGSAEPHKALAAIYDASGLPDLATDEWRAAIAADPRDTESLASLAYKYVAFGWNRDAQRLLERAVSSSPNDARIHIALGLVKFQSSDTAGAERELLAAQKLSPSDPGVSIPLIDVYHRTLDYRRALQVIDTAMPWHPNKALLWRERAEIYLDMSDGANALLSANKALALDPADLQCLYYRGVAEKLLGKKPEAIRDLESVMAKSPLVGRTMLLLGQMYVDAGQAEKGRLLIDKFNAADRISQSLARQTLAVAQRPDDPQAHLSLGETYLANGSYPRAIVELKRALALQPASGRTRGLLRDALTRQGRLAEAGSLDPGRTSPPSRR